MAEFNQKTVCEASEGNTGKFKAELFLAFFTISISVEYKLAIKLKPIHCEIQLHQVYMFEKAVSQVNIYNR